ncbi:MULTISPECIES: DUF2922 domain-containing protein [Bacillales]|uniref:DUF2922 domain-containing protein n=1 Tax=Bacillales TaxID=1385 RepID=UPI001883FDBF|nr:MULTISPECIES: DUF2922 domain-containing protein [Bacillaceae]MBF0707560.1 DUF2922 domain-containing protein [Pseudalkalibacillus hwajinpoensis]MDO6654668.1 DUF2922 domain-containing protein [Anaerobacillus sp. 1_MG-2023]WLR58956.1 DUF2922 domain-containing protein [Pseudalkalibacillus hwajinpoensis]
MAKTLELQFNTRDNKPFSITLSDPVEPVNPAAIAAAMDTLITQNCFTTSGGDLVSKKGARIVERNENDIIIG